MGWKTGQEWTLLKVEVNCSQARSTLKDADQAPIPKAWLWSVFIKKELSCFELIEESFFSKSSLIDCCFAVAKANCRSSVLPWGNSKGGKVKSDWIAFNSFVVRDSWKRDPPVGSKYCERAARCRPKRLAKQRPVNRPFQASKCSWGWSRGSEAIAENKTKQE